MTDHNDVPDYLQDIYNLLKCAFPEGIPENEYLPTMMLLHPKMSFRTLARVLAGLTNKPYIEVYNDASGFGMDPMPDPEEVEKVRQRLIECGFNDWLEKQL
jgi:hypothetical protein